MLFEALTIYICGVVVAIGLSDLVVNQIPKKRVSKPEVEIDSIRLPECTTIGIGEPEKYFWKSKRSFIYNWEAEIPIVLSMYELKINARRASFNKRELQWSYIFKVLRPLGIRRRGLEAERMAIEEDERQLQPVIKRFSERE